MISKATIPNGISAISKYPFLTRISSWGHAPGGDSYSSGNLIDWVTSMPSST
jgi:hypothetical protein